MQKTLFRIYTSNLDTPSEDDRNSTCSVLMISILWTVEDSEKELQQLTNRLNKTAAGYGMEISSEKSKILVNNIEPRPHTNIKRRLQEETCVSRRVAYT